MSFLELILSGISTLVMGAINLLFGTFFDEITKPAKASAGEGALPFDPFRMFDKIFGGAMVTLIDADFAYEDACSIE